MRRCAGILIGLAFMTAGVASGAVKEKTDKAHGVVFHLDGRMLILTLVPPEEDRQPVIGHRVTAGCATRQNVRQGDFLFNTKRWPVGNDTLRFRLKFDDSARVHTCVLMNLRTGDRIAQVFFRRRR